MLLAAEGPGHQAFDLDWLFEGALPVVKVIKGGHIQRDSRMGLNAVSKLERDQFLRIDVPAAKLRDENWKRRGVIGITRRYDLAINPDIILRARRSADGPGSSEPGRLLFGDAPGQAAARLHFPAGIVVVFQFRSESETKLVSEDLDFVLHKPAVERRRYQAGS